MMSQADETRYKIAVERFSAERERSEHILSRASQGIAISGTLMTLFLGLGNSSLTNLQKTNQLLPFLRVGLVFGLILFGSDLLVFLWAGRLSRLRADPNPKAIVSELANLGQTDLIRQLTSNLVDATIENSERLDRTAGTIKIGYYFLGVSILVVLLFGIGLVIAFSTQ